MVCSSGVQCIRFDLLWLAKIFFRSLVCVYRCEERLICRITHKIAFAVVVLNCQLVTWLSVKGEAGIDGNSVWLSFLLVDCRSYLLLSIIACGYVVHQPEADNKSVYSVINSH